jgi:hypothetical protein
MNAVTDAEVAVEGIPAGSALAEFERVYRDYVGPVTAYFARRCTDPHTSPI